MKINRITIDFTTYGDTMYLRGQQTPCYFSALDLFYCRFYIAFSVLYSFYDEGTE